jgi:PAS domain S-box-containing protein
MDEILDTAPCGFLSFTDAGTLVTANGTLHDMLGYERGELAGRHVDSIMPVASRIFYQTHFFPLLKLEGKAEEIFLSLRAKNGGELAMLANAVRRERDGIAVNECVVVPLRQRAKWEEEMLRAKRAAEEANRTKSAFLSVMSHELRTPLNAIGGYAEILSMGIRGPVTEAQLDDLRRVKSASQYLLGLINDLLSFARQEAGEVELHPATVTAAAALEQAEALVMLRIRDGGLDYAREACGVDLAMRADPERLQQILLNLLTNAVKFTRRGGRITVTCERGEGRALIHVRDTGRGIPAKEIDRIFEPFVQVERHRNESSQQGVGLGLAISRDLARRMGGELTVASKVGEGSVFTLALPAA